MRGLENMDTISLILLLLTGIVALVMAIFLFLDYTKNKRIYHLSWAISFVVLFLAGLLIVLFDFAILGNPLVPVVATVIPVGLAVGLLHAVWGDRTYGTYYAIYAAIMIVVQAATRLVAGLEAGATPTLLALHIPSGLIVVIVPLITALKKETEFTSIFFSLGGIFISLGGMLLAFLKFDSPILSADQIFAVLPLLLLIVGVLYFLGIFMPTKWKAQIPIGK
ncbi:MAG: hypothetical protein ACTSPE_03540 [Candidatus Thorarchaeota archaeon]